LSKPAGAENTQTSASILNLRAVPLALPVLERSRKQHELISSGYERKYAENKYAERPREVAASSAFAAHSIMQ